MAKKEIRSHKNEKKAKGAFIGKKANTEYQRERDAKKNHRCC